MYPQSAKMYGYFFQALYMIQQRTMPLAIQWVSEAQAELATKAREIGYKYILFNYGALLDIIDSHMRDFGELMKSIGMFKLQQKYYFTSSLREIDRINKLIKEHIVDRDVYYETLDEFQEVTRDICQKLEYAVNATLNKKKIPDSDYKTKVTTIGIMMDLALQMYNTICSDTNKAGGYSVISKPYEEYKCDKVMKWWHELYEVICRFPKEIVQAFEQDENINRAIDILSIKLTTDAETHKVYETVERRHPDMVRARHKLELKKAKQNVHTD